VKNWRGLFIALLVIAAILGIILLVILIVTPGTKNNLVFLQGRRYRCIKVGLTYSGRSQVGKVGWTYLVTVHHIAIRVHFLSFPHWAEYGGRAETIPAQNQRLRVHARPTLSCLRKVMKSAPILEAHFGKSRVDISSHSSSYRDPCTFSCLCR